MTDRKISRTSLVLMIKAPERSKRRLAARLGDAAAAETARRLAACALEDLAGWPGPTWLAPAEPGDVDGHEAAAERHGVVLQGEGNLGARIAHVSGVLRERGFARQIFIGIDCPKLDETYLRSAADALDRHDVVLGPAEDGGVVLMGSRRAWPPLEPLPWSTQRLGSALEAACRSVGASIATLEPRPDIDTFDDLEPVGRALADDPRPARQALREWLERVETGIEGSA